jgi:IclR family mhp operon transcriptional activator
MAKRLKSQVVVRTLEILRSLNVANGSTVSQLHALTRISRPALYRVLEAFAAAGYVKRDDTGGYHLTHLVRALSDGFRNEDRMAQVAAPILENLQRRVLWPTDLAVFANHAMYLRTTTRAQSALVMDRGRVGYRLPMLASAVGIAYIAFCPDAEREAILEALGRSALPNDQIAKDARRVAQLIRRTRTDGYATRYKGPVPETGSIALPIRGQKRVHACIAITYFAAVLKPGDAAARYFGVLTLAAREIEKQVNAAN